MTAATTNIIFVNNVKDADNLPSTEQYVKAQPKQDKSFSFIFHRFWPLSVV